MLMRAANYQLFPVCEVGKNVGQNRMRMNSFRWQNVRIFLIHLRAYKYHEQRRQNCPK